MHMQYDPEMTQYLLARLARLETLPTDDIEASHVEADTTLCEGLMALAQDSPYARIVGQLVAVYAGIDKIYA